MSDLRRFNALAAAGFDTWHLFAERTACERCENAFAVDEESLCRDCQAAVDEDE